MADKGKPPGNFQKFLDRVSQYFRRTDTSKNPTPQQQPTREPARAAVAEPSNALREAVRAYNQQNPTVQGVGHVPDGTNVSPSPGSAPERETWAQRARGRSLTPERTPPPSYPGSSPSPSHAPETAQTAATQPIQANDATDHTPHTSPPAEKRANKHPDMVDPKALLQAAEKIEARFDTSANRGQSIQERYTQNQDQERQPNREHQKEKDHDHDR